jgi:hypothetical protein
MGFHQLYEGIRMSSRTFHIESQFNAFRMAIDQDARTESESAPTNETEPRPAEGESYSCNRETTRRYSLPKETGIAVNRLKRNV